MSTTWGQLSLRPADWQVDNWFFRRRSIGPCVIVDGAIGKCNLARCGVIRLLTTVGHRVGACRSVAWRAVAWRRTVWSVTLRDRLTNDDVGRRLSSVLDQLVAPCPRGPGRPPARPGARWSMLDCARTKQHRGDGNLTL